MAMTPKKSVPKCGISSFKRYEMTDQSLSLRTTSEEQKNTDRIWEKNDHQKYLNVYESIEQRENFLNDQPYKQKGILQVKKYPEHKKSIFQNPLIQSSCSQITPMDLKLYPQNVYNTQLHQSKLHNPQHPQRYTPLPSRKNQMALTMIGENKIFYTDQQLSLVMQGSNIGRANERNKNGDVNSFNFGDEFSDSKFSELNQKINYFEVQTHEKQLYKGFYKIKYQKLYRKQSEQRLINSSNFIYGIDRSIEIQKNREMLIRPKSSNPRSLIKRQSFRNHFIDESKSLIFSSHKIPHKVRSQAKFDSNNEIQSKKQINQLIKKNKNYLAHKKNYQPLRSFSYHPDDEKENRKIVPKLSITTQTPLKQDFFLTKQKYFRYFRQPPKLNESSLSKTSLQKKVIKSGRIQVKSHQQTPKNSYQTTLNKIQDNIANDVQLSIRKLDVAG